MHSVPVCLYVVRVRAWDPVDRLCNLDDVRRTVQVLALRGRDSSSELLRIKVVISVKYYVKIICFVKLGCRQEIFMLLEVA
jgi:hypothetical protein